MPYDYTTWPYPVDADGLLQDAGIRTRSQSISSDRIYDVVIAEVARRTQRQFLPGPAGETRYFDGSGSPEQEVDEMVLLESVSVVGFDQTPGYSLTDAALTFEQGRPQTRLTVARGSVPAFTSGASFLPYPWRFPAGRQNIQVTGTFGFAALIPADLWYAVCGEMAYRLALNATFYQNGQVNFDKAGDEEQRFLLRSVEVTGWHDYFEQQVRLYKRPNGRRLRGLRNPMLA